MQNLDAEIQIIGACLMDNRAYYRVADLDPADFQDNTNRRAFAGIREMLSQDKQADAFTLADHTGIDFDHLSQVHRTTASTANVHLYAEIVKRESRRAQVARTLRDSLANIEEASDPETVAADCMAGLQQTTAKTEDVELGPAIDLAFEKARETRQRIQQGLIAGISTTLPRLNNLTGGFRGPRMIILGGRPGTFKTAYAWQVVLQAARDGTPCGFISLEMSADELGERALANLLQIDGQQFSNGNKGVYLNAERACGPELRSLPVWIDDSTQDWNRIEARIVEWKYRHDIRLAVIDYLQIIRHPGKRFEALSDISRRVKLLAKRLDMPVMVLSQLSRDIEKEHRRPLLSDLRECGNFEQDADLVIFLHRIPSDAQTADRHELILAKQRSGPARQIIELEVNGPQFHIGELCHAAY